MVARYEAELPLGAKTQRISKPDQSARGAGRVGSALCEGGFPPRETGRAKGTSPRRAVKDQDAKAFGPKRSDFAKVNHLSGWKAEAGQ